MSDHAAVLATMAKELSRAGFTFAATPAVQAAACEAGAASLRQQAQTCRWVEESGGEFWQSACGEAWSFTEGGPAENKARFCHGCGQRIEAVAYDEPLSAEDED